jgi:tetratricopeptide (TPR) repeat protein
LILAAVALQPTGTIFFAQEHFSMQRLFSLFPVLLMVHLSFTLLAFPCAYDDFSVDDHGKVKKNTSDRNDQAGMPNSTPIGNIGNPQSGITSDWLNAGDRLAREQRWLEAESAYRNVLRLDPGSVKAAVGHAQALMALGEAVTATVELEQYVTQHPEAVPALDLYAQWLEERWNDKKEAARLLEQCYRLTPSNAEVLRRLGDLRFQMDQFQEAMAGYQAAQKLIPQDPRLEVGIGRCLEYLNRSREAQKVFQHALELNRKAAQPLSIIPFRYAEFLYRQNRFSESVTAYGAALTVDPRFADAYLGRALALAKLRENTRAEQDALKALEIGGPRVDAHELLLRLARSENATEKALQQVEMITQIQAAEELRQARDRQMRQLLREGKPLMSEEKYAEAAPRFEQILKLAPENVEAYFALAVCYSQLSRVDEAIVLLRQYLVRRPTEADGYAVLGLLLISRGQQQEARRALERALELDPAQEEARQALHSLSTTSAPVNP